MNALAFQKTKHAETRQRQRAVSDADLEAVLDWGRPYRQPFGRVVTFLGKRDVARAQELGVDVGTARGVAVVVAGDGAIVTMVRSSDVRRLRRWGQRSCGHLGSAGGWQ